MQIANAFSVIARNKDSRRDGPANEGSVQKQMQICERARLRKKHLVNSCARSIAELRRGFEQHSRAKERAIERPQKKKKGGAFWARNACDSYVNEYVVPAMQNKYIDA